MHESHAIHLFVKTSQERHKNKANSKRVIDNKIT